MYFYNNLCILYNIIVIQSDAGGAELENTLGKYENLSDPATTALQGELICGSSISGVFNSDVNDYKYYAWILNADSVFENGCSITATLKADLNDFKTNISIFTAQGIFYSLNHRQRLREFINIIFL